MSFFLVFLAIVVAAGLVWAGLVAYRGRSLPEALDGGLEEPEPGLPPVFLPEHPTAGDVDRVRFSLGLRGYRMDQVDEVLALLRDRIAAQDAEISRLRTASRAEPSAPGSSAREAAEAEAEVPKTEAAEAEVPSAEAAEAEAAEAEATE